MLINLAVLLGTFIETFALQWTSSAAFPNGTQVNVCLGDNVTFPWRFNLTSSEHVINVEWFQLNQNREIPLASFNGDRFSVYVDPGRSLLFVPNAGLQLSGVTSSEMGEYSVRVNLNGGETSSQTAFLHEAEVPVIVGNGLRAYIQPATQFPVIDGESHLQLGCGHFESLGEPPISVTWRTPSGQFVNSTHNKGVFSLTLPNPVEGGAYTCQLNGVPTAERCLQDTNHLHTAYTVNVDEVTSTLLLLKNDVKWIREAYINQFDLLDASIKPNSCLDVKEYDDANRIHTIYPEGSHPVKVYCDQSTDNGGWTVIQRRQDGTVDFNRNWTEYENGFGNPDSEYWIGLANLHLMTSSRAAVLRVDLMDFNGNATYAIYNTFNISGPEDNYRLQISGYHGTAGDSFGSENNVQFSTYDREDDTNNSANCTVNRQGAWWYSDCSYANLNGWYYQNEESAMDGVWWYYWHDTQSLKRVEMKIRVSGGRNK